MTWQHVISIGQNCKLKKVIPTWAVEKKGISYQKKKLKNPPNFNKGV